MKYIRKRLPLFLILCMTVVMIPFSGIMASADEVETNPRVYVDGVKIETDVDPYIVNDRTLVPVALIVNYLGGTSEWDGPTQGVTLTYGNTQIHMNIGSRVMTVNGVQITTDVAPTLKNVKTGGDGARTMVPIRFVSENFGFTVGWDGDTTSVYVETGKNDTGHTTIQSVYLQANQTYADKKYTFVTINANRSLRDVISQGVWLTNPCRLYFDFSDTQCADTVPKSLVQNIETSNVAGVRVGTMDGGVVRLVVDMTELQQPSISYSDTGKEMTIAFVENRSAGNIGQNPSSSQTWIAGSNDTKTVTGTNKYDTIANYHPYADGRLVVAIDPGHGATTGGKRSFDGTLLEWEFNRSVAYKLKGILESKGIECVMTVSEYDQTDPSLERRVAIANADDNIDLFVSIHANAYGTSWNSANGWEVYSYKLGGVSELAAKFVESSTTASISEFRDRGVKTANFYVIKNTEMPAILIEHGFYTNKAEVEYLKSDSFRYRLAQADATGIVNFFNYFR